MMLLHYRFTLLLFLLTHTHTHEPHFNFENIFYVAIIIGRKIDGHLTKLLASKLISLLFTIFLSAINGQYAEWVYGEK